VRVKSGAVRNVNYIFMTYMPAWRCLDEYVTLDRKFDNLFFFEKEVTAAPVTDTLSSLSHASKRPLIEIQ